MRETPMQFKTVVLLYLIFSCFIWGANCFAEDAAGNKRSVKPAQEKVGIASGNIVNENNVSWRSVVSDEYNRRVTGASRIDIDPKEIRSGIVGGVNFKIDEAKEGHRYYRSRVQSENDRAIGASPMKTRPGDYMMR